ncbi:unnamed protein product [Fraxinus pennsylvanica]|uniref:Uncharacterized protein n=1 Tax=Fraxinus pennsylvanica TaxID=56036 RepID=A0AAD2A8C9_9LAMI|nr:unnamed protein product [Fraxinus pennsylvanica]
MKRYDLLSFSLYSSSLSSRKSPRLLISSFALLGFQSLLVAIISNYRVVYRGKILRNYSGLLWQGISIFSLLVVCSTRSKNHHSQSHLLVPVALRTCGGLDNLKRFMLPFQMMELYHGSGQSPLDYIMDNDDCVDWSLKGNFIAVAKKNSVIGDSDVNQVIKDICRCIS